MVELPSDVDELPSDVDEMCVKAVDVVYEPDASKGPTPKRKVGPRGSKPPCKRPAAASTSGCRPVKDVLLQIPEEVEYPQWLLDHIVVTQQTGSHLGPPDDLMEIFTNPRVIPAARARGLRGIRSPTEGPHTLHSTMCI